MPTNYWIKLSQPNTKSYFYNIVTKQTTFKKPREFAQDEALLEKLKKSRKVIAAEHLDGDWFLCMDNFSNWFWHNSASGESLWDIPADVAMPILSRYKERKAKADEERVAAELEEQAKLEADAEAEQARIDAAEEDDIDIEFQLAQFASDNDESDREISDQQVQELIEEPSEEDVQNLHDLLESLKVNPFTLLDSILGDLKQDERYTRLHPRISKQLIAKYCASKTQQTTANIKTREELYQGLLYDEITAPMRWELFQKKYRRDSRFRNMAAKEREQMFKSHISKLSS